VTGEAIFGAGCFWGVQSIFDATEGVTDTEAGYAGGDDDAWPSPSYRQVCTGRTGHAEVVRVRFDPAAVDFRTLMDIYMRLHDPTQIDGQGPDRGTQYRSIILATDDEQLRLARQRVAQLDSSGLWARPLATQTVRLGRFWPAEVYHQHYFEASAQGHGCHWMRSVDLPDWP
jgi:peptide-methionine (S)-S-oxide reductase